MDTFTVFASISAALIVVLMWLWLIPRIRRSRIATTKMPVTTTPPLHSLQTMTGSHGYHNLSPLPDYSQTQATVQNTTIVYDNTPDLLTTAVATELASQIVAPQPEVVVVQPDPVAAQPDSGSGFTGFGGGDTGGGGAGSNDWNQDAVPPQ